AHDPLRDRGFAVRGLARGGVQRVGRPGGRRDDDDTVAFRVADDARDALERGGRGDGRPAELEDGPGQRMVRAIAITSPSMADAVASPPAPGPLNTRRPARSVSIVTTFVGPSATPSDRPRRTPSRWLPRAPRRSRAQTPYASRYRSSFRSGDRGRCAAATRRACAWPR